jgi:hypothetical protein
VSNGSSIVGECHSRRRTQVDISEHFSAFPADQFRFHEDAVEVVLAEGDVKRQHLAQTPSCLLVVFEAVPPFRGAEVKGEPELVDGDVTNPREAIAGRYLGVERGRRFVATRRSPRGTLVRLAARDPRIWDLAAALPD